MNSAPRNPRMKTARYESVFDLPYPSPMEHVISIATTMGIVTQRHGGIASHRVNGNTQSFMLEGGR